jgi:membrane protease YdiL (CAAX protease family)
MRWGIHKSGTPTMSTIRMHPALGFIAGIVLFIMTMLMFSGFSRLIGGMNDFDGHAFFKGLLVLIAAAFMFADRRPLREFGVCAPTARWFDWVIALLLCAASGAVGSALIILTPAEGMKPGGSESLWQMIVGVWLISSIAEEIFDRGLIQSWMTEGGAVRIVGVRFTGRMIASGLLFGAMHLSIIRMGADVLTVVIIVSMTTFVGLVTAYYRDATKSLAIPVAAHIAANIGGFIGGVLTMIIRMIVTGEGPGM